MTRRLGVLGGLIGAIVMTVGLIVTAFAFVGLQGQSYNPLNHWVSELGDTNASELWFVFSIVLIIGAIGFGLHMAEVGRRFGGIWRWIFTIGGVFVALFGGLVGVFPMNVNLDAHQDVALIFFGSSMGLITLFSLYVGISRQKAYPRWMALVGVPMVISAAIFLNNVFSGSESLENPLAAPTGPRDPTDIVTISEWGIIIFILAWVIITAIYHANHPTD